MTAPAAVDVNGYCDGRFEEIRELFAANFTEGLEIGASFAATVDGEFVVDLWGGSADQAGTRPWRRDTIANVWSTTKGMTAVCVHMLADRRLLDLTQPVAKYWPEFAQNGKAQITVSQVLSHKAGLPDVTPPASVATLYDWDHMVDLLAEEAPWWEPGKRHLYHALTYGYLAGEVVRRITGKSPGAFFRDEVAEPLNADFHIGFGAALDQRVADMTIPPRGADPERGDDPLLERLQAPLIKDQSICNHRAWRAAEIPGANGHGNARACARVMSAFACGGEVDGIQLMSESSIDRATVEQCISVSHIGPPRPISWGLGFMLGGSDLIPMANNARVFGHGGAGGSMAIADRDRKVSWSYVMNKMDPSPAGDRRSQRLVEAFYRHL